MPAPKTTIPVPTGSLDQMKSDLKAIRKEGREVDKEMTKLAKKGLAISKDLIDRKKKTDQALNQQAQMIRRAENAQRMHKLGRRSEEARGESHSLWRQGMEGAELFKHGVEQVMELDKSFRTLQHGGPGVDTAEGIAGILEVGGNIPGIVGVVSRVAGLVLKAGISIAKNQHEREMGILRTEVALHGGRQVIDPEDEERRAAHPIDTKLSYIEPEYKNDPAFAPKDFGGSQSGEELRAKLARQIRNEAAGILRTIAQGLPLIGHSALMGEHIPGVDDEKAITAKVEAYLNSVLPGLIARAQQRAQIGDFAGANRDLDQIRKSSPELVPGQSAEDLYQTALTRRTWAQRKSIDSMGVRHIDGRDE